MAAKRCLTVGAACAPLDPGCDMQGLHGRERRHTRARAPGEEVAGRTRIGAARVRIADRRREEFQKSNASTITGNDD